MDTENGRSQQEAWSLYADTRIFRISASAPERGWITLTLEVDPEEERGIGSCGTPLQSEDASSHHAPAALATLNLDLRLEEIPHVIAVLNEIYRKHHRHATESLELDKTGLWGSRREGLPYGRTLTWPLFSRLEPETLSEDWKDRLALLEAYKVVADRLSDDMDKLGFLRPIG